MLFDINNLPEQDVLVNPRRMVLFGHAKVGKTSAVASLPNALIIDLESGSGYTKAPNVLNVTQIIKDERRKVSTNEDKNKINTISILTEVARQLDEYYNVHGTYKYDYIVVDTISALENVARSYATLLYRNTPQGKNFTGKDVVTEVPMAGWDWLRTAFSSLITLIGHKANICTIYIGHVKSSSINVNGKDLTARDLSITGKSKLILCADVDSIGYMFRNKNSETIVSFLNYEQDLATGSRSEHLNGQEFVLAKIEDGKLKTNWNQIFINN